MRACSEAGIPTSVMFAPCIPMVNDAELEAVLEAARDAGATRAGYVMLRLPHELKGLFREWLDTHLPLRADHVQSLVRQLRGGQDYDSRFGTRMKGEGPFAELIAMRFKRAAARLGFDVGRQEHLDESQFVPPRKPTPQGELF